LLEKSNLNELPFTWRAIVRKYDLGILLPSAIRAAIDEAYRTRLVDSDFLNSLKRINDEIKVKLQALSQLRTGFRQIGMSEDEIGTNNVELEVVMPRESINDELGGFHKELAQLAKQLQVLATISNDPTQSFRINSISTNDFTIALNIDINLGEIIIAVMMGIITIRANYQAKADVIKNKLSDLPVGLLDGFKKWVNDYVKEEIQKLVDRLPDECSRAVNVETLNQQKGPIKAALQFLCEKHEKGFNLDVRVGKITDRPGDELTRDVSNAEEIADRALRLKAIVQKSTQLTQLERQAEPILSLTAGEEAADTKAESQNAAQE
jgi:hypothetical protein